MKVFKEMVGLVTKQRLNNIELIDERLPDGKENLYLKLFKGIADGVFNSDEEAALQLYQTSAKNKKYLMLKSRLKERLINTLFFLNHKKIQDSPYQKAVYQCNRNYFCSKILLTHGARTSAIAMAKSTLALAKQFDLNEITLLCARMLRHHYSMMGLKQEFQQFNDLADVSLKLIRSETKAEHMYEQLLSQVARSKSYSQELTATAKEYFNQSKELSKYQQSFHLHLLHYRIGLLYYQVIGNYRLTLNLCNRLQVFLKKNSRYRLASREGEIALLKMVCCLYLNDYKNGKQNADEALKFYTQGSNNWFVVLQNYFMLAMHAGKHKQAAEIFEQATGHQRFQYLSDEKSEEWKIYEAYLHYVMPAKTKGKEFKILKFINEVPIYSKDKGGLYPAILIAQLLFMIDRGDEDRIEKNIESLRIFSSRYLSGKKSVRTSIFIKMLRQLINCHFKPEKVKAKAAPYLKKLTESKYGHLTENETMEIIPYEDIWSIILSRMTSKKQGWN
ncbi:MAG: hypothetical protein IPG01_10185 [Chitinophagaceae bacterium]|nr:hypothetical protein [Chitinophagaceae bacterium]